MFFDNLQVIHTRGVILEETHYYPLGLTMAGISSKALNNALENRYKFDGGNELQSKEFNDGTGLELYDANFRMLDPQLGRLHQSDPLAEAADEISPYAFAYNNPILINVPLGLLGDTTVNGIYYSDAKTLNPITIVIPPRRAGDNGTAPTAGTIDSNQGRNPFCGADRADAPALPVSQSSLKPVDPQGRVIPMNEPAATPGCFLG